MHVILFANKLFYLITLRDQGWGAQFIRYKMSVYLKRTTHISRGFNMRVILQQINVEQLQELGFGRRHQMRERERPHKHFRAIDFFIISSLMSFD